ncbi:pyruvate formate lyase activating enzyme [Bacilli bacterium PM5-3]|nr:pyruvate formate lyase activating enzyme [Bacilli bacterium PM5-3]
MSVIGYVNQYESMGMVDGPGTRFVVFLQGCLLKCQYCHNPETIEINHSDKYKKSSDEVFNEIDKLKEYYRNGGVTISGGEPLLQLDFVVDLCKKIKSIGLHIAIDTSGAFFNRDNLKQNKQLQELFKYVDLFLVDIKHIDDKKCQKLTTRSNENTLQFLEYLNENNQAVWIRYVLLKGISDDENDLRKTGEFIKTLKNVENVEILPYHNMAAQKWKNLRMDYQLKDLVNTPIDDVKRAYQIMFE